MNNEKWIWTDALVAEYSLASQKMTLWEFKRSKALPVVPEYEILSYWNMIDKLIIRKIDAERFADKDGVTYLETYFSARPVLFPIHSVRRKGGEVFIVGDKIFDSGRSYEIDGFIQNYKGVPLWVSIDLKKEDYINLKYVEKVKNPIPLFTTEDGKEIYSGDKIWFVRPDFTIEYLLETYTKPLNIRYKYFSTLDGATEYAVCNKPYFSVEDINDAFSQRDFVGKSFLIEKLKELAKEKIKA